MSRPVRGCPARVLVVADPSAVVAESITERVASAWPDHTALPDFERWSIADLDEGLSSACPEGGLLDDAGVIAVLDGVRGGIDRTVVRLADALERHDAPGVFLSPTEAGASRAARAGMLTRRGMVAISGDDAPERAASLLHGISLRQPMVRRIAAEARVTQRALSGAQGELDRLEAELREAARVQQNFAHRELPAVDGLDIGVIYRPAGHVSGDVFDVEVLDERRVGIFLADAAGHGVPAAMLTLFISRALPKVERSGGRLRIVPPGEALSRLNHDFACRGGTADRFATAVYGVYDTQTRELTVAGAGHPPPILTDPNAEPERVETDGPLLGVFPDANFSEVTIDLAQGRSIVFFSDGWEVAFPPPNADAHAIRVPTQTYVDRLTSLGLACGRHGSEKAVEDIGRVLNGQAGSLHQPDDITALVISGASKSGSAAA